MPTHGSLTKAGKVRSQTPKIEGKPKKSPSPKKRNRGNYKKRILSGNTGYNRRN
ncbi:MAG: 30S ribosomal protein S30e [archaeon]|nr:30S ribosomal protein S30e [Candidatus Bathyarchaeota archaeon]